jgi:hypothetical protein
MRASLADLRDGRVIAAAAGISTPDARRRGKCIVPGAESRTGASYGLLPTPDRVQGIVLPADGLIAIVYQATWQESVSGQAAAAIFIGSNQLQAAPDALGGSDSGPGPTEAIIGGGVAAKYRPLTSTWYGLLSLAAGSAGNYTGDIATGQVVGRGPAGGACLVFAAAGRYDIGVQFRVLSGSVTAKQRKLWVWTLGFDDMDAS